MNLFELHEPKTRPIPKDMSRVLVVENNESSRGMYRDLLSPWGYLPILAQGAGQSLLRDARSKARDDRFHLALVDMRLLDDIDDQDKSGLELISQLRPAACLMMSGYGGLADSRRATEEGASGFMGKTEHPTILKETLKKEARKLCASKNGLVIEPPELAAGLSKNLLIGPASRFEDQAADCLLRLFPAARRLRLEKIGTPHISSDLSTVPRPRSVILKVHEDDRQPVIVKMARESKITREIGNYDKYIDRKLKGNYVPVLRGQSLLWDIGGIKLSYVGDIQQNFSNFFQTQSVGKIKHSLNGLFTHGDLHGDNILVDSGGNIWVIDFERTREGHILQDFIEWESDIINRLPCTNESFLAFLSVCLTACAPREIKNLELTEEIESQNETKKAMSVISHLRFLAREVTGISDARQYLIGLLFNTLFRATLSTTSPRKPCQQRALMLASILCHRLDHWEADWPPPHWATF